ncbi:hypothetical protein DPMN_074881 [Dreissena polymorpha]|uniref:Uncharacterized protein n=1 Tax=Dreissena polymorpha TaxID=45954 RepID=A0A9D4BL20_DREPO|nr:hypothetical protein DPMN_074881 [Dreissena polymorpha]
MLNLMALTKAIFPSGNENILHHIERMSEQQKVTNDTLLKLCSMLQSKNEIVNRNSNSQDCVELLGRGDALYSEEPHSALQTEMTGRPQCNQNRESGFA